MRQFLRLITAVERNGIYSTSKKDAEKGHVIRHDDGPLLKSFWEFVEKCHPFVFSPNKVTPYQVIEDYTPDYGLHEDEIDAPFPVFSIETSDGPLSNFNNVDGELQETMCTIVVEYGPKSYGYFVLVRYPVSDREKDGEFPEAVFASNAEGPLVKEYLQRLNKEKTGLEEVRVKVKIGRGKDKRRHEIRRVVHVTSRTLEYTTGTGKKINWSHRFEVRGHWVKLSDSPVPRMGKNRDGDYCVPGFTWRSEHVRGPDNLPLVKKTRIVGQQGVQKEGPDVKN